MTYRSYCSTMRCLHCPTTSVNVHNTRCTGRPAEGVGGGRGWGRGPTLGVQWRRRHHPSPTQTLPPTPHPPTPTQRAGRTCLCVLSSPKVALLSIQLTIRPSTATGTRSRASGVLWYPCSTPGGPHGKHGVGAPGTACTVSELEARHSRAQGTRGLVVPLQYPKGRTRQMAGRMAQEEAQDGAAAAAAEDGCTARAPLEAS